MWIWKDGRWDRLGPGPLCCSAGTWTHLSSSHKIQRNCMGLKITLCTHSWGKFWTKETQGAWSKSRGLGAKAGYCACPLHTPPPKGWADHQSHPSSPTPGHTLTLTLTLYKERARPPPQGAGKQGTCCLFSLPSAAAGAPIKPCLNLLSGLWSVSIY